MRPGTADVIIVGGGPAGLAAATSLRRLGLTDVVVVEREKSPGGIPRHCDHSSFGLKDLGRPMTGPRYARALVGKATRAGVTLRTETTVTEVGSDESPYLVSTSPLGQELWTARAILLATGCRERPRAARLVPGSRAVGVFTTGELQQFTYLHQVKIGNRAVVVGAEHVSFSAVMTLRDAGIECVAVMTDFARHQTYPALRLLATRLGRVPLLTEHRLTSIQGRGRVEAVVVESGDGRRIIPCDTVVLSGEWVAEGSLALSAGLSGDTRNGGRPEVTDDGATVVDGIFAAGSVVRPGESAASATRAGTDVARAVAAFLQQAPEARHEVGLQWSSPIRWVSPQRARRSNGGPVRLRVDEWVERPTIVFRADDRVMDTVRLRRMIPGRTYTVDGSWMGRLEESTRQVQVSIG